MPRSSASRPTATTTAFATSRARFHRCGGQRQPHAWRSPRGHQRLQPLHHHLPGRRWHHHRYRPARRLNQVGHPEARRRAVHQVSPSVRLRAQPPHQRRQERRTRRHRRLPAPLGRSVLLPCSAERPQPCLSIPPTLGAADANTIFDTELSSSPPLPRSSHSAPASPRPRSPSSSTCSPRVARSTA